MTPTISRRSAALMALAGFLPGSIVRAQTNAPPLAPWIRLMAADANPGAMTSARTVATIPALEPGRISVLPGAGVLSSVARLNAPGPAIVAVMPGTVIEYIRRSGLMRPLLPTLRYIARLGPAEVHVLARQNVVSLDGLAGQRVSFGMRDSPSQITASLLFDRAGIRVQPVFLEQADALRAVMAGEIGGMVEVSQKPVPLFFHLNPIDGVHLVPLPPWPDLLPTGVATRIRSSDYPLLLGGESGGGLEVASIAVPMVLAVFDWPPASRSYQVLARFVDALFDSSSRIGIIDPAASVPGWLRFGPAAIWPRTPDPANAPAVADARPGDIRAEAPQAAAVPTPPPAPQPATTTVQRPDLSTDQKNRLFEEFLRWRNTR